MRREKAVQSSLPNAVHKAVTNMWYTPFSCRNYTEMYTGDAMTHQGPSTATRNLVASFCNDWNLRPDLALEFQLSVLSVGVVICINK